ELLNPRQDPPHEGRGLFGQTETHEAVEGEGRIPDPGVAVVPVPYSADVLRKAEGGRGDDRAVLLGREQLQRERGAVDHLAPAAPIRAAGDPAPPEVHRILEGVALVVWALAR